MNPFHQNDGTNWVGARSAPASADNDQNDDDDAADFDEDADDPADAQRGEGIGWWLLLDWAKVRIDGAAGACVGAADVAVVERKWCGLLRRVLAQKRNLVAARGRAFFRRLMRGKRCNDATKDVTCQTDLFENVIISYVASMLYRSAPISRRNEASGADRENAAGSRQLPSSRQR